MAKVPASLQQARAQWAAAQADFNAGRFATAATESEAAVNAYQVAFGGRDNAEQADALNGLGLCFFRTNRTSPALSDFQMSAAMLTRLSGDQDSRKRAIIIGNVGWCMHVLQKDEDALPNLKQSADMLRRISGGKDDAELTVALQNLGACYDSLERYDDAFHSYDESLGIARRLSRNKDSTFLANDIENVANSQKDLGHSAAALPLYQEDWKMRQRLANGRDDWGTVGAAEGVAGCLDDLGQYTKSLPIYHQTLEMVRRLSPNPLNPSLAEVLNDCGSCMDYLGRSAEALNFYDEALKIERLICQDRDARDLATDLENVAQCLETLGRESEALPLYESALQMRRRLAEQQDDTDLAESLDDLGGCYEAMGRYTEAYPLLLEAFQMRSRIYDNQDHPDVATSLDNLGDCEAEQHRFLEAYISQKNALEMRQRIYPGMDHPDIAESLCHVAMDLGRLHRLDGALAVAKQSVQMGERLRSPDLFKYYALLGNLLFASRDYSDASVALSHAIDALEQSRSNLGGDDEDRIGFMSANSYWNPFLAMVWTQLMLHHPDTAAEFLDRGRAKSLLDILERGERLSDGDLLDPIEKKAKLTNNKSLLESIESTRSRLAAADNSVRELTSQINHARALNDADGLAEIKSLRPKLQEAQQEYADANRAKFSIAGKTTFTESVGAVQIQALLGPHEHMLMYSMSADGCLVLLIPPPGQPITGALLRSPDGKTVVPGMALLKLINAYRRDTIARGMDSVRGVRLVQTSAATQPTRDTAAEGYQLFRELIPPSIWQQIKDDQLVYVIPEACMSGLPLEMLVVQPPKNSDAKDAVYWLDQGPLLCYDPSAAALVALRRQEADRNPTAYTHEAVLVGDPVLQRSADQPRLEPPQEGVVVNNVSPGSPAETIGLRSGAVIVSYGSVAVKSKDQFDNAVDQLELLQFHGKLDQTPKLKFWVDGQILERQLPMDAATGLSVTDMTPLLAARLSPAQPIAAVAMRNSSLTRYGALTPLPGTRQEVDGIYRVLTGQEYSGQTGDRVVVLLGEDATSTRLDDAVRGTRFLHLATHGLVESGRNAIYSSLVLSQPEVITPQDTGMLTLQDLFDHWWGRLDGTELVVLSACDSEGLDESQVNAIGSEGVFGLPWGFMYAGSPAVVASLWEVEDASTAKLMQTFYGEMQSPQMNKLAAFTTARRELRKHYPEPFFWAPFIYLGDPN
jgi:tetratricopeptide (TPR) repeat protein